MPIQTRWNRMVRKFASSPDPSPGVQRKADSSVSSGSSSFLSKTFSWRAGKSSASTSAASDSDRSDRSDHVWYRSGSSSPRSVCRTVGTGVDSRPPSSTLTGHSLQTSGVSSLDDMGIPWEHMTESQRHQARLSAYTIKFGASRPGRPSLDQISPCATRRASVDTDYGG